MNRTTSTMSQSKDGLDDLIAAAEGPLMVIPAASEVLARAKRADTAARAAQGSNRPVDSGSSVHPRLRVGKAKQ